jgi:hypothetical protein
MEVEQLRKRGWIPPGLARRQRSLKERLRANGLPADGSGGTRNPFFGSSKSVLSRLERKKQKAAAAAAAATTDNTDTDAMVGDDPFADNAEVGIDLHGPDEINEQDVDDFFEIERPTSMIEMTGPPARALYSSHLPNSDAVNFHRTKTSPGPNSSPPETAGTRARLVLLPPLQIWHPSKAHLVEVQMSSRSPGMHSPIHRTIVLFPGTRHRSTSYPPTLYYACIPPHSHQEFSGPASVSTDLRPHNTLKSIPAYQASSSASQNGISLAF